MRDQVSLKGQSIGLMLTRAATLLYHSYIFPILMVSGDVHEVAFSFRMRAGFTDYWTKNSSTPPRCSLR